MTKRTYAAFKAAHTPAKAPVRRSIASFKASHDPGVILPNKLKKALEVMAKEGPEVYAYETQDKEGAPTLQQRSGLSASQISQHRAAFAPHIVRIDASGHRRGKFVWFSTTKAATKARGGPVNLDDFA